MVLKLLVASAGLIVAAAPAPVPTAPPVSERFTLERSGDGFVRLDRQTGAVSYCRMEGTSGLVCRLAADERSAYETKISELTDRLDAQIPRSGKPSLEQKKTDAAGEISLVEFILKRMLHSAREVADTAHREGLAPEQSSR